MFCIIDGHNPETTNTCPISQNQTLHSIKVHSLETRYFEFKLDLYFIGLKLVLKYQVIQTTKTQCPETKVDITRPLQT